MGARVMVYSHDTFGLGNIRRMLTISDHLLRTIPDVSVLLVTGSPMVHAFRMGPGLDYIKLPCLSRVGKEEYAAKTLGTDIAQLMQLRAGLILSAARDFQPDVLLVDKKPDGVKHELQPTLTYLRENAPDCKMALILRDILDAPESTMAQWEERNYEGILRRYFDSILVLGTREVFDATAEYQFSRELKNMTMFTGYLRRVAATDEEAARCRAKYLRGGEGRLALVTPGGGEDGFALVRNYVAGAGQLQDVHSAIICGPEMPAEQRAAVVRATAGNPHMTICEFTGEMASCMAAADVVVCMAGYNTICEVLSFGKPAVVVPRVHPVSEQWIRAERLSKLGLLQAIHPAQMTPRSLAEAVAGQLAKGPRMAGGINLEGLGAVSGWVSRQEAAAQKASEVKANSMRSLTWDAALPTF